MIRTVLIADNRPICAEAIKELVQKLDSAIEVEMVNSIAAVDAALAHTSYATLLLDPDLVDSQGLTNLSLVRANRPDLPVLVVSGTDTPGFIAQVRAMGAHGFVSKHAPVDDIRAALSVVLLGGQWFPHGAPASASQFAKLSPAQTRVMVELGQAQPNKQIAHKLHITEATVKSHLSAIYRTLDVSNRSQAILALRQICA